MKSHIGPQWILGMTLTLGRFRTTEGKSQILDLPSNQTRPSWSHSWDAKICDFPPVVRAHLHNEMVFNTWVPNNDLVWLWHSGGSVLRMENRRFWISWVIKPDHLGLTRETQKSVPLHSGDVGLVWFFTREMRISRVGTTSPEWDLAPLEWKITRET